MSQQTYNPSEVCRMIQSCKAFNEVDNIWKIVVDEKWTYTLVDLWAFKWLCQQQTYKIKEIDSTELYNFFKGVLGIDLNFPEL